jgi:hypothetical protein
MNRISIVGKNWLYGLLLVLPLLVAGAVYASSRTHKYVCPLTGEELRCPLCCPLNHSPCDQCDKCKAGE